MDRRTLGGTLEVSALGLGCMGMSEFYGTADEQAALATIDRALELGVTFFDTADSYGFGRSESLLGIVLSRARKDIVIATKVGVMRNADASLRKDFSKQHIFQAIDASLRRLRSDYVDLYQAHNPTLEQLRREEIQEAMDRLQEIGKIRYWGVSISTNDEGIEIINRGWGHALQVLYNALNQSPATELFPLAKQKGYGIIARVPLASGLLTGKFRTNTTFPVDDVRQNFLTQKRLEEALHRVDEMKSIIGGGARSLSEAALQFVLANDAVSTTIPGARNVRQVETNVAAAEGRLTADVIERLQKRLGDYNFYQRHSIKI